MRKTLLFSLILGIFTASPLSSTPQKKCVICHKDYDKLIQSSVHGKGGYSCVDCHAKLQDDKTNMHPPGIYRAVDCRPCHDPQSKTYDESFHGKFAGFGEKNSATCVSCHDHHQMRSYKDPLSTTHPSNLPKTCGACHPGVGPNVVKGKIHAAADKTGNKGAFFVRIFYTILIIGLVSAYIIYIAADLNRRRVTRWKTKTGKS